MLYEVITVSGLIFTEPIRLIPIPWIELTPYTEDVLPAVATGIQLDLGLLFLGMVLPFWAVIGSFIGVVFTMSINPTLYKMGLLHRWHPGMRTVETLFANNFDFYMSVSIGLGLSIGVIGIWQVVRSLRKNTGGAGAPTRGSWADMIRGRPERGDINFWLSVGIYFFSTLAYTALCVALVPGFPWLFFVLYGFIYTPFISYVTARMEGIAGQVVNLPLVDNFV